MRIEDLQGRQFGRYTITNILGRGGMAVVYRAHDTLLRRDVALKLLYPHYAADPTLMARFRHEAVLAARLEHPNIVPIYDIGEDGGLVYIAMKLLHGRSLAELLQQRPQLPPDELRPIIAQVAAALDYAHANGVVHRDIKAANILLEPPDRVILTDFGIAKSLVDAPNLTSTSMMIGTPDYMAPEQITRQPIGPHTDIYALGVLAFRCLTGRRPFEGGTEQVLLGHLYGDPPAPSGLAPGLPPAVDQVILGALARDPALRPASAGAFAQALGAALTGQGPAGLVRPSSARGAGAPHYAADAATLVGPATPSIGSPAPLAAVPPRRAGFPVVALLLLAALLGAAGALFASTQRGQPTASPTASLPTSPAVGGAPTDLPAVAPTETPTETSTEAPTAAPSATAPAEPSATAPAEPSPAPAEPSPAPARPTVAPTRRPAPPTSVPPTPVPPSATPVPPSPTPLPPSATPVPPTATPTPCPVQVVRGFAGLLEARPELRQALGCPLEQESGSQIAEQPFQRGSMLWFDLDQYIYVLYGRDSGRYQIFPPDQTVGSDPPPPAEPPSPELVRPVSGFGTVWGTHSAVFNGLGWGTAYEDGPFDGAYQPFENGLMLFSSTGLGRGPTIYVLLYNGRSFFRFDDTFSG